jgi:hypothetical protein
MATLFRKHLSYANVMATIAVFVALGGSSYSAITLSKNSVKSRHIGKGQVKRSDIGKNAVTSAKVKNFSLIAQDFRAGQLPSGPPGQQGSQGPPGEPATKLFAAIAVDGKLVHGTGVTAAVRTSEGHYTVTFDRSLNGCVGTASYYQEGSVGYNLVNHFALGRIPNQPTRLSVDIWNSALNQAWSVPFSIVVFC